MRKVSWVFVAVLGVGGCVAIVLGFGNSAQNINQPIVFNHFVHINEADLECSYCHTNATTSTYAGLPGKDICLDCHDVDDEQGDHSEKDRLFSYVDLDKEIGWVRVSKTNPDVFFSHRRHVVAGELECLVCHENQRNLHTPPPTIQLVMKMADCIDCHKERKASSDCLICHR